MLRLPEEQTHQTYTTATVFLVAPKSRFAQDRQLIKFSNKRPAFPNDELVGR